MKRRMLRDIERRNADMCGASTDGYQLVRKGASKGDGAERMRRTLRRNQLGTLPMRTALMSRLPLPCSARIASTRRIAPCHARNAPTNTTIVSPAFRVNGTGPAAPAETGPFGAPFGPKHARRGNTVGNDSRARRDDEVCGAALPVAPAAEGFERSSRDRPLLGRSWMVHDGRVHFEDGQGADFARSQKPFAAEVVIAFDDDIRTNRASTAEHSTGT